MSEASSHTHKSTRPFSIISCDDANTQQTHNKHMHTHTHTHTHTSFFCAERICDSPKSPGSALVAQSIASRITGFRHVTTSLSWDRSKRRPARSYGLQLDERASTMVLGRLREAPLHEADRSFDAAMPTSSRWRPRELHGAMAPRMLPASRKRQEWSSSGARQGAHLKLA